MNNTNTSTPKPSRPYSDYNIYWQLQREYILQVELGFQPDYEYEDVFDPLDSDNYQGPPLPSKYSDLVYLNDWHLPGKEKRRKRRHRKTHGKIGFKELSLKIASSWKSADAETKLFCAKMSDISLLQYKKDMRAYKLANPDENKGKSSVQKASKSLTKVEVPISPTVPVTQLVSSHAMLPQVQIPLLPSGGFSFVPTDKCTMEDVDAAFDNDINLKLPDLPKLNPIRRFVSDTTLTPSEGHHSVVDLDDDDIIEMFKSDSQSEVVRGFSASSNDDKWIDDLFTVISEEVSDGSGVHSYGEQGSASVYPVDASCMSYPVTSATQLKLQQNVMQLQRRPAASA